MSNAHVREACRNRFDSTPRRIRRSQHANFGGAAGAQDHPTIKKEESTLTIIFLPPNSVPDKSIAFLAPSGVVKWMVA